MTNTRKEYISKARKDFELINARIIEFEAKANEKTGEVRRELRAELNGIKESRARAKRRLAELRLASKPAWENAKQGVEQARHSVSDAIDSATKRLHQ